MSTSHSRILVIMLLFSLKECHGSNESDQEIPFFDTSDLQESTKTSPFVFLNLKLPCYSNQLCSIKHRDDVICYCDNECVLIGDCCADWYTLYVSGNNAGILTVMENPLKWYMENAEDSNYADILTIFMRDSTCIKIQNGSDIVALRVITTCPKEYPDDVTRNECKSGSLFPLEHIPVSLRINGTVQVVFKNKMCALCYGYRETELVSWTASALCPKNMPSQEFKTAFEKECSFFMNQPDNVGKLRQCQLKDSPLECDGNQQIVGTPLSTVCQAYVAPVYDSTSLKRNPHCALCLNGNDSDLHCGLHNLGPLLSENDEMVGMNILFNFNTYSGSWYPSRQRDCLEMQAWYPDKNGCHSLFCPKNYMPSYGRCIDDQFAVYNTTNNIPLDHNGIRGYNVSIKIAISDGVMSTSFIQNILQLLSLSLFRSGVIILRDFQLTSTTYSDKSLTDIIEYHMLVNITTKDALEAVVIETLGTVQQFDHVSAELTNTEDRTLLTCINTHITQYTAADVSFIENNNMYIRPRNSNITISLYNTRFQLRIDKTSKQPIITFLGLCKEGVSIDCTLLSYTANEYEIKDKKASINNIKEIITYFDLKSDVLYVCDNLTSLGVQRKIDGAMQILTVVMITVSIISLLALIFMHCVFSSLRTVHGKNLMAFSTSLLTAQTLFLLSSYIAGITCMIIAISQHYFWLCSFMWTSVMAFDLASKFGAKTLMTYKTSTFHFRKTFFLANGLPLLLVVSCVVVDTISSTRDTVGYGFGSGGYCWIGNPTVSLFVFGIPIALCLLFNMICFGIFLHGLYGTKLSAKTVRNNRQERNYCIIYAKISILLGGTWIFGFLSAVINFKSFLYINICLNGLQGFFLFLGFISNARVLRLFRKQKMTTSSTISLPSSEMTDTTRPGSSMTTDQRF